MIRPGDVLVNPATGLRTSFRQMTEELLQVEWIGDPGWTTGPDHVHRLQEERFEVLSGSLAPRNPLLAALILRHFEDEIFFVRPPLRIQRPLLGALAAVARAVGLRPEHAYRDPGRGGGAALTERRTAARST